MNSVATAVTDDLNPADTHYGLKQQILSPLETLAQSVSTIAPSASPGLALPLVFALAGEGTCIAYGISTLCVMMIALCIVTFAQQSASPGSLYAYARKTLPPSLGAMTAWAHLFAYILTASSLIGGFISYAYIFLGSFGRFLPPFTLAALAAGSTVWIAHRDVKISARVMLWIEGVSVCLISFVIGATLWKYGLHFDSAQFTLQSMSLSSIRLGAMLAIFSWVGFESATTLGSEAKDPLKTIPRAVLWSALLSGLFFLVCAYGEVLAFRGVRPGLSESMAPMRFLAGRIGVSILGPLIDIGVLISMFAATLACVIAAARLLILMAHHGLVSRRLGKTHERYETPGVAGLLVGALAFLPVAIVMHHGVSGADIFGWMGSLAVFGFLTAYALVAFATLIYHRQQKSLRPGNVGLSFAATVTMIAALGGTLFPVPPTPYRYFPYIYGAYLFSGMFWFETSRRRLGLKAEENQN